jgi:hypothetical protein
MFDILWNWIKKIFANFLILFYNCIKYIWYGLRVILLNISSFLSGIWFAIKQLFIRS